MRDWLSRWLHDRGFDVRVDPVGNLIGLREGGRRHQDRRGRPHLVRQQVRGRRDRRAVPHRLHPMPMRRDALLGAAHRVVTVNELTGSFGAGKLHTSVGELTVEPNSPVVVAREVRLLMDIRSRTSDLNAEAFALLEGVLDRLARHGFSY